MNKGRSIVLAIKGHFTKVGLNENEFFSPVDIFAERYMNTTYGEMLDYRKAIRSKFICLDENGIDLNPLELTLPEFMEQNPDLYSHPFNHNVVPNCKMLEKRIKQFEVVARGEIMAKLKSENRNQSDIDSVLHNAQDQLLLMSIEDFRQKRADINLAN